MREKQGQDLEATKTELRKLKQKLEEEEEAVVELKAFYQEARSWCDLRVDRNIGYVQYAAPISVDKGRTEYTSDWAVFAAAEETVKPGFEGNVVDMGSFFPPSSQVLH